MESFFPQLIFASLSGGFLTKLAEIVFSRWKETRGKKKGIDQRINALRAALARNTYLAIKSGVDVDELEKDPEDI